MKLNQKWENVWTMVQMLEKLDCGVSNCTDLPLRFETVRVRCRQRIKQKKKKTNAENTQSAKGLLK